MLSVRVDGIWLRAIGPHTDIAQTFAWPHGLEQVTWRMAPTFRAPLLERGGRVIELFDGGVRRGIARLAEPSADGEFSATGIWSQAAGMLALDSSGNATVSTNTAITQGIAKGALTWTLPAGTTDLVYGSTSTANDAMKLLDLIDQATKNAGQRWYIDGDGAFRLAADPTTPAYVIPQAAAGRGLTLAEDDYYSHLVGTYLATGPVYATVTVGDTYASTRWGYREARVDLTDMGIITAGTATTALNNRLALTGARLQFAESLTVGHGEITTPGGTPVSLSTPRAGEMVRLMGVADNSRPGGTLPYTDIVIGRSTYTDGAPTATLAPVNLAARNLEEVLVRGSAA
jgi:hypothetical protein